MVWYEVVEVVALVVEAYRMIICQIDNVENETKGLPPPPLSLTIRHRQPRLSRDYQAHHPPRHLQERRHHIRRYLLLHERDERHCFSLMRPNGGLRVHQHQQDPCGQSRLGFELE